MKEHSFSDWSYSNFTNLLIALPLIERQVVGVAGIEHYALGMRIVGAPIMHGL
ncbi:hypothetical protein D3C80_1984870 [compost metagenome]